MNWLFLIFGINFTLLIIGIIISWIDIHLFGSGLYLALVSTVTVVIVLAFCLVGTDEQTQPTVAKQMWSKSRQTLRRYTVRNPRPQRPTIIKSPPEDIEMAQIELQILKNGENGATAKVNVHSGKFIKTDSVVDTTSIKTTPDDTNTTEAESRIPYEIASSSRESLRCLEFDNSKIVYL